MKCYKNVMVIRLCHQHKHFYGVSVYRRQRRMWNMTFTVDDQKPSTEKWWAMCTIYLQETKE